MSALMLSISTGMPPKDLTSVRQTDLPPSPHLGRYVKATTCLYNGGASKASSYPLNRLRYGDPSTMLQPGFGLRTVEPADEDLLGHGFGGVTNYRSTHRRFLRLPVHRTRLAWFPKTHKLSRLASPQPSGHFQSSRP